MAMYVRPRGVLHSTLFNGCQTRSRLISDTAPPESIFIIVSALYSVSITQTSDQCVKNGHHLLTLPSLLHRIYTSYISLMLVLRNTYGRTAKPITEISFSEFVLDGVTEGLKFLVSRKLVQIVHHCYITCYMQNL